MTLKFACTSDEAANKDEVLWQTHKKLVFASLSLSHSDLGTSGLTDLCVKPEKKKKADYILSNGEKAISKSLEN